MFDKLEKFNSLDQNIWYLQIKNYFDLWRQQTVIHQKITV